MKNDIVKIVLCFVSLTICSLVVAFGWMLPVASNLDFTATCWVIIALITGIVYPIGYIVEWSTQKN